MPDEDFKLFKEFIRGKTVAVVGPSPHLEGKALGAFIDSHDLVVRINEVSSRENSVDYGLRTDVIFGAGDNWHEIETLLSFGTQNPTSIVWPKAGITYSDVSHAKNEAVEAGISLINFDIAKHVDNETGWPASPSTGFLCLVSIFSAPYGKLFVCGLSFYTGFHAYNKVKAARHKTLGLKTFTVSGHTVEDEVSYLQGNLPKQGLTYDEVFERLIVDKKFKGRNPAIFVYQVFRNTLSGTLKKILVIFSKMWRS